MPKHSSKIGLHMPENKSMLKLINKQTKKKLKKSQKN